MGDPIVNEGKNNPDRETRIDTINKKVREIPLDLPSECFLYKVPGLSKVNPEAYKPMLVSIGPYHRQNTKVKGMEEHKLRYLRLILERKKEVSVESYYTELEKLEKKARNCYVDRTDNLKNGEFVEMLLLDGCFIIEFFDRIKCRSLRQVDPILKVDWMVHQICVDLMLLENQIPYFVLCKLYHMAFSTHRNHQQAPPSSTDDQCDLCSVDLRHMATLFFKRELPQPRYNFISDGGGNDKLKHLLHLVYILCAPAPQENTPTHEGEDLCIPFLNCRKINTKNHEQMRSAVELREAGVTFKKVGKGSREHPGPGLFDVKFHKGSMEIPCFSVEDLTETFFRNLIAYEQVYLGGGQPKYFTDFVTFMDQLINSEKDVELLRLEGIIENDLGDDKRVSDIFTKLGDGVTMSSATVFRYYELFGNVNDHCEKICKQWMATLRGKYFNNPWAGVSTFAAIVLLLLTLAQTIVALYTAIV